LLKGEFMRKVCIIFGGSGYIGKALIRHYLEGGRFEAVYNFDLVPSGIRDPKFTESICDVRLPISAEIPDANPETSWIINLAALCREPGSKPHEYFDTNIKDAENVLAFAGARGFRNLFFTSTMSTYGRAPEPTPETAPQYPETPYGISKLVGEKINEKWLESGEGRRLIICRPSVIFGPNDVGNILRMIKAVNKGYFFFPGDPHIVKAYGYIQGLVESFDFTMDRKQEARIVYNYAEWPLLDLQGMVDSIKQFTGRGAFTVRLPHSLLLALSQVIQAVAGVFGKTSPIHPVRVKKVAYPTYIKPQYLLDAGFQFKYAFPEALKHWRHVSPADFSS
jgi:nucleoside-diphosphate-sugar epimerase